MKLWPVSPSAYKDEVAPPSLEQKLVKLQSLGIVRFTYWTVPVVPLHRSHWDASLTINQDGFELRTEVSLCATFEEAVDSLIAKLEGARLLPST